MPIHRCIQFSLPHPHLNTQPNPNFKPHLHSNTTALLRHHPNNNLQPTLSRLHLILSRNRPPLHKHLAHLPPKLHLEQRHILLLSVNHVYRQSDLVYAVVGGVGGRAEECDELFRGDLRRVRGEESGDCYGDSGEC